MRRLKICKHVTGMAGDIFHLVPAVDAAIGIDEVAVTHGVFGMLLARITGDFVLGTDRAIHIAQQAEREVLSLGEGEIVRRCVE